jgi:predicted nucleotidyltransferase
MPTAAHPDPVLADFLGRIAPLRPLIHRLTLFGSRARGDHRPDSDYDVLVVVSHRDEMLLDRLYEAVIDVLLAHGRLISLKVFEAREFDRLQSLRTPFTTRVAHEGVPIG